MPDRATSQVTDSGDQSGGTEVALPGDWQRPRELTESERDLGTYVHALMYAWRPWLHRRVEKIEFADALTYRRRTSIDLTVPLWQTPLTRLDADARPLFCIPLALLRKKRLRGFSLRNQDGSTLPLLTQVKNGAVAVGVLLAAARQVREQTDGEVPAGLYADLWALVHSPSAQATSIFQHLGRQRSRDPDEVAWRSALVGNEQFMALAADLARNFLVLTILRVEFDERRIVKLEYEQEGDRPALTARIRLRDLKRTVASRRREQREAHKAEQAMRDGGNALVRAQATTKISAGSADRPPQSVPQPAVRLYVKCGENTIRATTGADGSAVFLVPAGEAELTTEPPPGLVEEEGPESPIKTSAGEEISWSLGYRQVADARDHLTGRQTTISLKRLALNGIAWRSRRIVVLTPAVAQGQSFHIEVEAPEGLKITRSRLVINRSYAPLPRDHVAPGIGELRDGERGPLQRSHLHVMGVAQGSTGALVLNLRPRASVIVRAGTISALATSALLWVVAHRQQHLLGSLGSVATLLLVVPGGLSAYVARPRENPLTSSMVFGLRVLTMTAGFAALVAAATVIFARDWRTTPTGTLRPGGLWAGTDVVLWTCFGVATAMAAVLAMTWFWTVRMPERGARG